MSESFADFVIDLLAPLGPVTARRMFGGLGFYRDGKMFALAWQDALYLKFDKANEADFADLGTGPFKPFAGKNTVMPYWEIPAELLDDPDALCALARNSLAAAARAGGAKKPKAPKKPSDRAIAKLPGLGPKTAAWLGAIGIDKESQLRKTGAVEAYRRLKARFPKQVSLNALWGMEAALLGIAWTELPEALKEKLKAAAEKKTKRR